MRKTAHIAAAPSANDCRRGSAPRTGFTIVELMIVVTLMVAITGIVMPSMLGRLAGSIADAAIGRIEATAIQCRALAQQEGRALRLTARPRPDGSAGIYIEAIGTRASGRHSLEDVLPADGQESPDEFERRTGDPRSTYPAYVLPDGYVLTRQPPRTDDRGLFADPQRELGRAGRSNDFGPRDDQPPGAPRSTPGQLRLTIAVFLPDGTALAGTPLYLIGEDVTFTIEINRWTGGVRATRVSADDEGGLDEDGWDQQATQSEQPIGARGSSR